MTRSARQVALWSFAVAVAVAFVAHTVVAFSLLGQRWTRGAIPVELQLGAAGGLLDGSADWDACAGQSLAAWNAVLELTSVRFTDVRGASNPPMAFDSVNSIAFVDDVFGTPFGPSLLSLTQAFATVRNGLDETVEADVLVNRAQPFNCYRGPQRSGPPVHDLQRTVTHALGHVIGLGHPDAAGQTVAALMNAGLGDVDTLQLNDIQGALTLAGVVMIGIPFPPRNEALTFYESLETEYRDTLQRSQTNEGYVNAEGSAVWFPEWLRYVLNGCEATEATTRVLMQIRGQGIQPVCSEVASGTIAFPPRNLSLDFLEALDAFYRDELQRSVELSHVDLEGKAVWLQEYLRYRVDGVSDAGARTQVFRQIQDAAVQPQDEKEIGHLTFMSPHAAPIALNGGRVFVANTPADTLDIIDAASRAVVARVPVGIDPVGIAVRPDGKEIWVANHVSDSVSVVDIDPTSLTYLQVIATVQDFDPVTGATRFDEPAGVAFASNEKAYVVLSSENRVAVTDVASHQVVRMLTITAQDPRALVVGGDRLYVIPFESNNQTQLSGCRLAVDGDLCTFDSQEHVLDNNNVLSLNYDADIIKHPAVPDRDLYVFDTRTDELVEVVDSLGTLLYGLAVDSAGRVFVTQTDARNDVNGRAGTLKHGLAELENRAFLNRITRVDCSGGACGAPEVIDLEPLPPAHPAPGMALATPFAIQISGDDSTLVVSAASSDRLFTVDAASGAVLGRVSVGAVPRGVALESVEGGQPSRAWVLNAVANTVSVVDLSDLTQPGLDGTIVLADPTHPAVKRGRIAFNDADVSTTGTFSCESCHPDGHTDQLLWVLDTPVCNVPGCTQIPPRLTMPVRGLRETAPYHWDGIPGDPFGGNNTANIRGSTAPNCDPNIPESCTRFLVDSSLASTMCRVGDCPVNDEGKQGALTGGERDDLATFLLSVPYPPAQRRSYDNVLSNAAKNGFKLFHIDGDNQGDPQPNVCGNCHRMPFWVSSNAPGTGMDAPTWRGAYDRWLILPQGRLNLIEFPFYERITRSGTPERELWRFSWGGRSRFDPVWDMVLEGSTGFSGSLARQVTLNQTTTADVLTGALLDALELSAREGGIVLQGEGVFIDAGEGRLSPTARQVFLQFERDTYVESDADPESFSRTELISLAASGLFVGTFTGRSGVNVDVDRPQPALWTVGAIQAQRRQVFPTLSSSGERMVISGRHIREGAHLLVDGRRVSGNVSCQGGVLPTCVGETIEVQLETVPSPGMHFLQVQNPEGLFSNDYIFLTEGDPSSPESPLSATLSSIQSQIFSPRCVACHGTVTNAGLDLSESAAFTNLVNTGSTQTSSLRVVPGDPESSYLIHKLDGRAGIVGSRMPRGGPFLSTAELDVIKAWISAGALDN